MLIHTWPGPAREMRGYNGAGAELQARFRAKPLMVRGLKL